MGMEIGPLHVRRCGFIHAPPERVWSEFGDFPRLSAWLGLGHKLHELEVRVGGSAVFSVDVDGEDTRFSGEVVVVEPERELSFRVAWEDPRLRSTPMFWTLRLTSMRGGTLFELFHHGYESMGDRAASVLEGYESAFDNKHVKALRAIVESSL